MLKLNNRCVDFIYLHNKLKYKYQQEDTPQNKERLKQLHYIFERCDLVYGGVFDYNSTYKQSVRAIKSRKLKKYRINQYLSNMLTCYDELWFITLTFDDAALSRTTENTRHRQVSAFLNENCRDYYANQDFGKENGREHYHAVIAINNGLSLAELASKWRKTYGILNFKKMQMENTPQNRGKMSSYLLKKITNHAGKLGTGKGFHKRGLKEVDELPF